MEIWVLARSMHFVAQAQHGVEAIDRHLPIWELMRQSRATETKHAISASRTLLRLQLHPVPPIGSRHPRRAETRHQCVIRSFHRALLLFISKADLAKNNSDTRMSASALVLSRHAMRTTSRCSRVLQISHRQRARTRTMASDSRNSLNRPSPPPLPREAQREFEELVRKTQAPLSQASSNRALAEAELAMHPDARAPLAAEFDGEVNPLTGERGGPKREPVKKWVEGDGDWSFKGRVSDF